MVEIVGRFDALPEPVTSWLDRNGFDSRQSLHAPTKPLTGNGRAGSKSSSKEYHP
jgi:hypothetical protein